MKKGAMLGYSLWFLLTFALMVSPLVAVKAGYLLAKVEKCHLQTRSIDYASPLDATTCPPTGLADSLTHSSFYLLFSIPFGILLLVVGVFSAAVSMTADIETKMKQAKKDY